MLGCARRRASAPTATGDPLLLQVYPSKSREMLSSPWGHCACPHLQRSHPCAVPCTTWPSASFPSRTAAEHNSHHLCLGAQILESLHAALFSQPPSHCHRGIAMRWVLAAALPALSSPLSHVLLIPFHTGKQKSVQELCWNITGAVGACQVALIKIAASSCLQVLVPLKCLIHDYLCVITSSSKNRRKATWSTLK